MSVSAAIAIDEQVRIGDGSLALIAGPCSLESRELALEVAGMLRETCERRSVPFVFKASFDKANRTSGGSFRSIGMHRSLEILDEIRSSLGVPVLTDVHESCQVPIVAEVVDVVQIPAFLCRQTDLLAAAGASGRVVNIKKGQFMAPEDMGHAVAKVRSERGARVLLTERGTTFGYRDLVVDFRGLQTMRELVPVVFDATHSVQSPGGAGGRSAGKRQFVAGLARAAVAFGIDALFLECHPAPSQALSDAETQLTPAEVDDLLDACLALHGVLTAPAAA
ncbi:MAG: 3-deoxy-8-phosphooctulonate synthase [Solirubrobacterales bacterium]|nr:3-deoxy-8-phosphooctulonate synthase [Solirubrobacterales bacterium]